MSETEKPPSLPIQIGIDTGGTFTDFIVAIPSPATQGTAQATDRSSQLKILKVPSTPKNPAKAILLGLREAMRIFEINPPFQITHGSTVAANAILERKGARVALITTKGFGDILTLARQNRPGLYNLHSKRVEPLIPRQNIYEVSERVRADGSVQTALDLTELTDIAEKLCRAAFDAIAICFLHAYANPSHEIMALNALKHVFEKNLLNSPQVVLSSKVYPQFREYERFSTTTLNAYIQPLMNRYLVSLSKELERLEPQATSEGAGFSLIKLMRSDGGQFPLHQAQDLPLHTVLSGPAAGVIGAQHLAREAGYEKIITLDMGGTSTDVAIVTQEIERAEETIIGGLPLALPILNIHSVGAGGGSLVRFDSAGALRVGPESAGAEPGPLCYGHGQDLTVTDMNLFLGRLDANAFLGGKMILNSEGVEKRLHALAHERDINPFDLAENALNLAELQMESAIRLVAAQRGQDPHEFALFCFGGAGALHAAHLAQRLMISKVIIPPNPGGLSAYGMLLAPALASRAISILQSTSQITFDELHSKAEELTQALEPVLFERADFYHDEKDLKYKVLTDISLQMRYRGEAFEVNVPLSPNFADDFHRLHELRYGHSDPDLPSEIVKLTCFLSLPRPKAQIPTLISSAGPDSTKKDRSTANLGKSESKRKFYYQGKFHAGQIYAREQLSPDFFCEGPALITEYSATTFLPPGTFARLDLAGNVVIEMRT